MTELVFYFVDVFAEAKYAGNQLAVVRNAAVLSSEQMQAIANEMHFSETTFVLSDQPRNGGYDVRIFTPANEVPFAGHPTLGTAYIIKRYIAKEKSAEVVLNLKVGQITVSFQEDGKCWMKQLPPTFGKTFQTADLAKVLQLEEKDFDNRFPLQEVSTGLPFVIVPLRTLDAVKRAKSNLESLTKLTVEGGVLVFSPQTYVRGNDLNVRVFVDLLDIPEDPATGSGNGCLAGYLSRYRYFGSDQVDIRVEQGYEVRRPSLLLLKAESQDNGIQVWVGGKVVLVAEGKLV